MDSDFFWLTAHPIVKNRSVEKSTNFILFYLSVIPTGQ